MAAVAQVLDALGTQRVLPVLRSAEAEAAVRRTRRLLAAGCRAVELTTSTPDWPDALARASRLTDAHGRPALVGLGTVSSAQQAETALEAGAAFLVSPWPAPAVREVARRRGALFVEGGSTPGEIATAVRESTAVAGEPGIAKLFPAHLGGPSYLRSLRAVLPTARLLPTGGIGLADVQEWLDAGAFAVGIGGGLPDDPAELAAFFVRLGGPR